jgi:uncharacterized membrane protein
MRLAGPKDRVTAATLSRRAANRLSFRDARGPWARAIVPELRPKLPWIVRLSAPRRLGIVLAIALISFFALEPWIAARTRLLLGWNLGAMTYLALAWTTVARTDATMTRVRAQTHDQSGYVIFVLVVTAASASFVAIGFLVGDFRNLPYWGRVAHLTLSISALLLSWLLIQTLFAFHYARWYYSRMAESATHRGGLRFPSDKEPDYLDFAYYSFVVGMTSQVSDVMVTTRQMRRLTLVHGVLAFIFNIAILAMSINIIGGVF